MQSHHHEQARSSHATVRTIHMHWPHGGLCHDLLVKCSLQGVQEVLKTRQAAAALTAALWGRTAASESVGL